MIYPEQIKKCHNINDIIDVCHEAIPQEYKAMPWKHPELNHGIDLLHLRKPSIVICLHMETCMSRSVMQL